ncbi:N-acetylmuramoyl-L-alanine amidase [Nocardioides sp.]|uniref:FG-GAP-like repeat-containing protein n=1 Tax=Nocardioides sp. TaxID=35761 RepID=UPI0035136F5F
MCQRLLVLGVICAALTPAARIHSLDLVPDPAEAGSAAGGGGLPPLAMTAYVQAARTTTRVPTAPVDPVVKEYPLTAPAGARVAPGSLQATARPMPGGASKLISRPQRVTGFGAVGVTWASGTRLREQDLTIKVRLRDGGRWSPWRDMVYHDDHGPDPDSAEARRARPGTDELLVGTVKRVQVKIVADRAVPSDLKLAVIDPGAPSATRRERAAIDTATLPSAARVPGGTTGDVYATSAPATPETLADGQDQVSLAAAAVTPKPVIFSREQWGADESMRDKGSLRYYEVHAGFVHHTVNANNYTRADVPAILRGIYAYHTQSRGWSDIGYNYLVDRFGRIWEGRYGGVDRPVVGAHTLGYNEYSFAMSAIGNYEIAQPSDAMVQAYGALFAWKLSLHGINAASTRQLVGSTTFQAINGHRDAASTACPGKYLYARIPEIRKLAAQAQVGFAGRQLESDVAATPQPDLIVRRKADGLGFVIPLKKLGTGSYKAGKPIATGLNLGGVNRILSVGDWDRDGFSDLVTRNAANGALYLRRGLGDGTFAAVQRLATGFGAVRLLAAVGDMTGDGYPDLMGAPNGGSMMIWPGRGPSGLGTAFTAYGSVSAVRQIGIGRWDGDGAPDSLLRRGPRLEVVRGNGPGGLTGAPKQLAIDLTPFDWVVGISDIDLTGHADLVVRTKADGGLWLVPGSTSGFGTPVQLGSGFGVYDLVG